MSLQQAGSVHSVVAQIENDSLCIERNIGKLGGRTWCIDTNADVLAISKLANDINDKLVKLSKMDGTLDPELVKTASIACKKSQECISKFQNGLGKSESIAISGVGSLFANCLNTIRWACGWRAPEISSINVDLLSGKEGTQGPQDFVTNALSGVVSEKRLAELRQNPCFQELEHFVEGCGLKDLKNPSLLENVSIPGSVFIYRDGEKFICVDGRDTTKDPKRYTLQAMQDVDGAKIGRYSGLSILDQYDSLDEFLKEPEKKYTSLLNQGEIEKVVYPTLASPPPGLKEKLVQKAQEALVKEQKEKTPQSTKSGIEEKLNGALKQLTQRCPISQVWHDGKQVWLSKVTEDGQFSHYPVKPQLKGTGGFAAVQKGFFGTESKVAVGATLQELESTVGIPMSQLKTRQELVDSLFVKEIVNEKGAVDYINGLLEKNKLVKMSLPPFIDVSFQEQKGSGQSKMRILRFQMTDIPQRGGPKYEEIPFSTSKVDPRGDFGGKSWSQAVGDFTVQLNQLVRASSVPASEELQKLIQAHRGLDEEYPKIPKGCGQENCFLVSEQQGKIQITIAGEECRVEVKEDSSVTIKGVTYKNSLELENFLKTMTPFDVFIAEYQKQVSAKQRVLEQKIDLISTEDRLKTNLEKIKEKGANFVGTVGLYLKSDFANKPEYTLSCIGKDGKVQAHELIVTNRGYVLDGKECDSVEKLRDFLNIGTVELRSPYAQSFLKELTGRLYTEAALSSRGVSHSSKTDQTEVETELLLLANSIGPQNAKGAYRIWKDKEDNYQLTSVKYNSEKEKVEYTTVPVKQEGEKKAVTIKSQEFGIETSSWTDELNTKLSLISPRREQNLIQQVQAKKDALLRVTGDPVTQEDLDKVANKLKFIRILNPQVLSGMCYIQNLGERQCELVRFDENGKEEKEKFDISKNELNPTLKKSIHDLDSVLTTNSGIYCGSCTTRSQIINFGTKLLKDCPVGTCAMVIRTVPKPSEGLGVIDFFKSFIWTTLSDVPALTIMKKTKDGLEMIDCPLEVNKDGSIIVHHKEKTATFKSVSELYSQRLELLGLGEEYSNILPSTEFEKSNAVISKSENDLVFPFKETIDGIVYKPILRQKSSGFTLTVERDRQQNSPFGRIDCSIDRAINGNGQVEYTLSYGSVKLGPKQFSLDSHFSEGLKEWIGSTYPQMMSEYDKNRKIEETKKGEESNKKLQEKEMKQTTSNQSSIHKEILPLKSVEPGKTNLSSREIITKTGSAPIPVVEKVLNKSSHEIRPQWVDMGPGFLGDMKLLSDATLRSYGKAALGDSKYKLPAKYKINQLKTNGDYYKLLIRGMTNMQRSGIEDNKTLNALPLLELFQLYELACFEDNRVIPQGVEQIFADKFLGSIPDDTPKVEQYINVALAQAKDAIDYDYYKGLQDKLDEFKTRSLSPK